MLRATGMPAVAEHGLEEILVHAERRRRHAGADVRDAGELEQALDGAVLAERPVQDREARRRRRRAPPALPRSGSVAPRRLPGARPSRRPAAAPRRRRGRSRSSASRSARGRAPRRPSARTRARSRARSSAHRRAPPRAAARSRGGRESSSSSSSCRRRDGGRHVDADEERHDRVRILLRVARADPARSRRRRTSPRPCPAASRRP